MTGRQRLAAALGALMLVTGARCGSTDKQAPAAAAKPRTSPSPPSGHPYATKTYATRTFVLPLTVLPAGSVGRRPPVKSTNRLIRPAADGSGGEIGFLVPVLVYPPGNTVAVTPPTDYAGYLRRLSRSGAQLHDAATMSVDGRAAALMTATSAEELDGALGCPQFGSDRRPVPLRFTRPDVQVRPGAGR